MSKRRIQVRKTSRKTDDSLIELRPGVYLFTPAWATKKWATKKGTK